MTNSEQFQRSVSNRLLLWSVLSIGGGALLQAARSPFWRAFGQQAIGWGAIDAALAIFGRRGLEQKVQRGYPPTEAAKDLRNLRRILWFNAGLDVLYMLGGLALFRRDDETQRGHGAGILVQGLFLFKFDLIHALLAKEDAAGSGDISQS
ncbi:MAG TPA: hypothetical protein GX400_18090 [Chloroflexi bacterium]|nr:hypothetical protein [Chloroflexota bacterium]